MANSGIGGGETQLGLVMKAMTVVILMASAYRQAMTVPFRSSLMDLECVSDRYLVAC